MILSYKRLLLITLYTLLPWTVMADSELAGISITYDDGLPSNQVNDITIDSYGFMWMATANGLCRYDGHSFITYPLVGVGKGVTNAYVGNLFPDNKNRLLWIRTATYCYACYDCSRACFVDYAGMSDPQHTYQRCIAGDGSIWMYEKKTGVRHVTYHEGQFVCRDYDKTNGLLPDAEVNRLLPDSTGGAWVMSNKGLFRIRDGRVMPVLKDKNVVLGDSDGSRFFFLTADHEVFVLGDDGHVVRQLLIPGPYVSHGLIRNSIIWQGRWVLFCDRGTVTMNCRDYTFDLPAALQMHGALLLDKTTDGSYWLSDKDDTLWLFPRQGEVKTFRLLRDTGFYANRKRRFSTALGNDGNYYIASYGNGLFVYHPDSGVMDHYRVGEGKVALRTNYLIDIYADHQGSIWISQEEAGVVCLRKKEYCPMVQWYPEPGHEGEMSNRIQGLKGESDTTLIVRTRAHKTYRLSVHTGRFTLLSDSPSANERIDSITDRSGRTWIATWEKGLLCREAGGQEVRQYLTGNTTESRINGLTIDRRNILWVATANGLYGIDTGRKEIHEKQFMHYTIRDGLPSNELTCLLSASDGSLWIGGHGTGAVRCTFDQRRRLTTQRITVSQGLPNNTVHAMVEDRDGNIWVGTVEALACIHPDKMSAERKSTATSLLSSLYSDNCAMLLADGRVVFGTNDGITVLTPSEEERVVTAAPKAIVTDIFINGTSVYDLDKATVPPYLNGAITLSADENTLTLCFSDFDYGHTQETMYQYYLEGVDKDWREPTNQYRANYDNLSPGHYLFHLRAGEGGEETLLKITIRQPWYNTWWAWLLYLTVIGTSAWTFFRHKQKEFLLTQQMKVQKQVNEFRINFFTQVAHEFRTPMAIISGSINKMSEDRLVSPKPLQTAQRGMKRLTRLVNQLMEFRKINADHLRLAVEQGEMIGFVREVYQDFWTAAQQKELYMTFSAFEKKYVTVFDRHILETVAYNLFSNAVKYTPQGGQIEVRIRKDGDRLLLTVEDSGPGIDEQRREQLFQPFMHGYASQGGMGIGLYTSYKMALRHKGSLTYAPSQRLGGSLFKLTIPADDRLYEADDYRRVTAVEKKEATVESADRLIREMLPQALNDYLITIIEDDLDMLEQIKAEVGVYFRVKGYTSGHAGLEAVRSERPSLLICDVLLPDISGFDIVKQIKSDGRMSDLPVIMLTALDDEQHHIRGYEVGADDYMVKPCNYHILIARVIQLIRWSHKEPSQSSSSSVSSPQEQSILTSQADKRFLERIHAIVAQHISDPDFSINMMAEMMHMGRTKLYGKVKELTGMSPNKLFVEERMRLAAQLLDEGELNISEISYRVGIPDATYFNKCFRQYYGVSPSKYRKGE